ncbi:hypothetical protein MHYP_G00225530 [Metynnis hypsauchen]
MMEVGAREGRSGEEKVEPVPLLGPPVCRPWSRTPWGGLLARPKVTVMTAGTLLGRVQPVVRAQLQVNLLARPGQPAAKRRNKELRIRLLLVKTVVGSQDDLQDHTGLSSQPNELTGNAASARLLLRESCPSFQFSHV